MTHRDRQRLREIAEDTCAIIRQGHYLTDAGSIVKISRSTAAAITGTRLYLPDDPLAPTGSRNGTPVIEVTNESTLGAIGRLGNDVAALVFASARSPGGGFLSGAQAQEESLARSSALYPCLTTIPDFYTHHRAHLDLRYSDRIVYSPAVPVIRDDAGQLLDPPHQVAFLTAAAPNLGAIQANQPDLAATVPAVLRVRARRILQVAAAHGHRRLILGAWGCGVFRNEPATVADSFKQALSEVAYFDHVLFAVLDNSPRSRTYRTFARTLQPGWGL